jgi:hypothetical protein
MANYSTDRPFRPWVDDEREYLEYDGWSDDVDTPALTLTEEQQAALAQAVGHGLDEHGCDNTLRGAREWAADARVDWPVLEAQLKGNGGYCDCEVLFNVIPDPEEEPDDDLEPD